MKKLWITDSVKNNSNSKKMDDGSNFKRTFFDRRSS